MAGLFLVLAIDWVRRSRGTFSIQFYFLFLFFFSNFLFYFFLLILIQNLFSSTDLGCQRFLCSSVPWSQHIWKDLGSGVVWVFRLSNPCEDVKAFVCGPGLHVDALPCLHFVPRILSSEHTQGPRGHSVYSCVCLLLVVPHDGSPLQGLFRPHQV